VTVEFVLLLIAAYLLGSVPLAYLLAKWSRGIDIRQYGSGNVGASNVRKLASRWTFIATIIFDLGKGMVMVWIAKLTGLGIAQQVTVGIAAIIGHNWSVFLRFNGGRGILTTLGVVAILVPWLTPIVLVIAFGLAPLHQLALGTLIALVLLPVLVWFFSQPLGISEPFTMTLGSLAMLLIAITRRLTAPRTSLTATVSGGELFINRLLFDRDIRDREAWIHRRPTETNLQNKGGDESN
jgi:glycerol-3-phosphate acyltransferase PlsY